MIGLGVLMGLGGTAAMDLWAVLLNRLFGQPLPNWGNVGRWVGHWPALLHDDINAVPPVPGEARIGWAFHYAVGVVYGVAFVLLAGAGWVANPSFLPLWGFSVLTIAAGWFLLHPGLGLGWALSRTASPWRGRAMGLLAHTVFALGMAAVAWLA